MLDPSGVELVEEIVQQQDRFLAPRGDDGVLCQLQCDEKRFLLPLRAVFSQGVAADAQHQIVAVDARGGELIDEVALPCGDEQIAERAVVQLRFVDQLHRLAVRAERAVVGRDERLQLGDGLPPTGVDGRAVLRELTVVYFEHRFVGRHRFEQPVALGQHGVVTHDRGEVGAVELRDEGVEVAAAFVGGVRDEGAVGGRDDRRGDQSHVIGQPIVLLAVAFEDLAALARERADDSLLAAAVGGVAGVEHEELLAVADALCVGHRECRLAHREVVDGIEDVGLPGAVVAYETVDPGDGRQLLLLDILEVDER